MRVRATLLLVSVLLALSSARAQQPGAGGYHALVIGNNDYASLPKLKTAEADARAIAALLKDAYGFETTLLLNATRQQIVSALFAYRQTLRAEDNLLVYYAGHGINDRDADKSYWLPVDAARTDDSNWISADDITTRIRAIPARHVLVVSDSCYSGTLTRGLGEALPPPNAREQFLQRMSAGRSRTLMASGGDEPVADSGGSGHSVFAAALLRGLRETDKGKFTAAELFRNYVQEPVAGRAQQTPEYNPLRNSGHEGGDFVFVKVKTDGKTVEVAVSVPPASRVDPAQQELAFWTTIQHSADAEDFKDYLARYPNGLYAGLARRRIAALAGAPAAGNTARPSATPSGSEAAGAVSTVSPSAYLFQEEFLNNQNGWPESDNEVGTLAVTDGKYIFENKKKGINFTTWLADKQIRIDQPQDFSIEAQMTFAGGDEANFYGFIWGRKDGGDFHHFGISANGYYAYRKSVGGEWNDPIPYRPSQHLRRGNATNKLAVRKRGAVLEFYINDAYVNSAPFEPFAGSVGFHLNHYMRVEIEYIRVKAGSPAGGADSDRAARPAPPTPAAKMISLNFNAARDEPTTKGPIGEGLVLTGGLMRTESTLRSDLIMPPGLNRVAFFVPTLEAHYNGGGEPLCSELTFTAGDVAAVSLTRPGVANGASTPAWRLQAFNAAGAQVGDAVGEGDIARGNYLFPAAPQDFTITAAGIRKVRICSKNDRSTFNAIPVARISYAK